MRLVFACTFIHGFRFTTPAVIHILPFQGNALSRSDFSIVETIIKVSLYRVAVKQLSFDFYVRRIQLYFFKLHYWMRLVFACTFIHGFRFALPAVIHILPFQGTALSRSDFSIVETIIKVSLYRVAVKQPPFDFYVRRIQLYFFKLH
jgi:hypothetical protein